MTKNENVILTARDIVVEFDVRDKVLTAIRGVSLELIEGEVLALVGESGSGKSVLTKTFTGMLEENGRIANGTINYRGQELTETQVKQRLGRNSWCKNCNDLPRPNDQFGPRLIQSDHKFRGYY